MPYVSTGKAARVLELSSSTVRNMLESGRLLGRRGTQPVRPRWEVETDANGIPIGPDGPILAKAGEPEPTGGKDGVQGAPRDRIDDRNRFREAALLLLETLERQRRAIELQAEANRELSEALAEQGRILTTVLVPDVNELSS